MVKGFFLGFLLEVLAFFLVLIFVRIRSSPSLETRVPPTTINPRCCWRASSFGGPQADIGQFALSLGKESPFIFSKLTPPVRRQTQCPYPSPRSKTFENYTYLLSWPHDTSWAGEGTAIYGLYRYVPLWRVWLSSSLLWHRVYKSESLGLEKGIIFHLNWSIGWRF